MDAHACYTSRQTDDLLRSHLQALKDDPFLASAWIIMVYEKNTGYESGRHYDLVSEYQPMYALYDRVVDVRRAQGSVDEDPGITTTHTLKNRYAREMSDALRYGKIFFYKDLICANPHMVTVGGQKQKIMKEFIRELRQCRVKYTNIDPDKIDLGAIRALKWDGKMDALGKPIAGQHDDMAVCGAQCVYWMKLVSSGQLYGFPYQEIYPQGVPQELTLRKRKV